MTNTNRKRGDYFERQTRSALECAGWVVVRSAGSLGPADLVAVRRNSMGTAHVLLVSCKTNGRASPAERAALLKVADQAAAEPLLASRPARGTIELVTLEDGPRIRATLHPPTKPRKPRTVVADDG
jgi:Holliday junction resolvase